MNERGEYEEEISEEEKGDFARVTRQYELISKIGEGTFSTVYRAVDVDQACYENEWLYRREADTSREWDVAIKRLYVTSSPQRIHNEIEILRSLTESDHVLPIITAFRKDDQVYIVLPYYQHCDFRHYYSQLTLIDIRHYMRSLFLALHDVHEQGIIHRDIKPANFLYDPARQHGELVDFGLAERLRDGPKHCPCLTRVGQTGMQSWKIANPTHARLRGAYLKDDPRPSKRANRAGTRGFRPPEVLLKCDNQTTSIDIWSAGVILLTFLSGKFPFFNAADDVDALVELTCIFGTTAIKDAAARHDVSFETTVPTLFDACLDWPRLLNWCRDPDRRDSDIDSEELEVAYCFLSECLCLDSWQRWTAEDALRHPFLADIDVELETDEVESLEEIETECDQEPVLDIHLDSPLKLDSPAKDRPMLNFCPPPRPHSMARADAVDQEVQVAAPVARAVAAPALGIEEVVDEVVDEAVAAVRRNLNRKFAAVRESKQARDALERQASSLVPSHAHRLQENGHTARSHRTDPVGRPITPVNQVVVDVAPTVLRDSRLTNRQQTSSPRVVARKRDRSGRSTPVTEAQTEDMVTDEASSDADVEHDGEEPESGLRRKRRSTSPAADATSSVDETDEAEEESPPPQNLSPAATSSCVTSVAQFASRPTDGRNEDDATTDLDLDETEDEEDDTSSYDDDSPDAALQERRAAAAAARQSIQVKRAVLAQLRRSTRDSSLGGDMPRLGRFDHASSAG